LEKFSLHNFSEDELIELCIQKNTGVQKLLYERYAPKFISMAMRYFKNKEDALSVVHDAFLKIFNNIKTFKREAPVEIWMKSIVLHTIIDHWRKMNKSKNIFVTDKEMDLYKITYTDSNDEITEHWNKLCSIPSETLMHLIQQLPPATGIVFNLYAIEGYSHAEISKKLNISINTSKWHLSNARNILKSEILSIIKKINFNFQSKLENND
jgi:RNA polymerase sigma-70 factor (ECF subfamily)